MPYVISIQATLIKRIILPLLYLYLYFYVI